MTPRIWQERWCSDSEDKRKGGTACVLSYLEEQDILVMKREES